MKWLLILLLPFSALAGDWTAGEDSVGASAVTLSGVIHAQRFVLPASGVTGTKIDSIYLYINQNNFATTDTNQIAFALYADGAGTPAARIAVMKAAQNVHHPEGSWGWYGRGVTAFVHTAYPVNSDTVWLVALTDTNASNAVSTNYVSFGSTGWQTDNDVTSVAGGSLDSSDFPASWATSDVSQGRQINCVIYASDTAVAAATGAQVIVVSGIMPFEIDSTARYYDAYGRRIR